MLKDLEPTPLAESSTQSNGASFEPLSHSSTDDIDLDFGAGTSIAGIFDAVNDVLAMDDDNDIPNFPTSSSLLTDIQPSWQLNMDSLRAQNLQVQASQCLTKKAMLTLPIITKADPSPAADDSEAPSASITVNQSGRWHDRFQDLCKFREEYGHCCVPSHWPQNPPLAQWVKRQRYQSKLRGEGRHSTMTEERKDALDNMGFVWDPHSAFWEERLNELHGFREKHGHCNVPTKYPENPQLAVWAKCQRRQFKLYCTEGAKRSNMTLERIQKLTRVGFVFNPREAKRNAPRKSAVPSRITSF